MISSGTVDVRAFAQVTRMHGNYAYRLRSNRAPLLSKPSLDDTFPVPRLELDPHTSMECLFVSHITDLGLSSLEGFYFYRGYRIKWKPLLMKRGNSRGPQRPLE
jgi:hypothetical protein